MNVVDGRFYLLASVGMTRASGEKAIRHGVVYLHLTGGYTAGWRAW